MIPLTDVGWQTQSWQALLKSAITDPVELATILQIDVPIFRSEFPLLVPWPYLSRIRPGDPLDPLLLQVLPQSREALDVPGYVADPLQELDQSPIPGVIQKYHGRLLVVATGACGINCRYCFRRHFPYAEFQPSRAAWDQIISTVAADSSITEVILSGGDPLLLNDRQLADIARRLADINHVTTLRLHTRLPVVIPQRIDAALLDWISQTRLQVVVVLHINHSAEIDPAVAAAARSLSAAGVTLLNQSVLLKGINDQVEILTDLSRALFAIGVLPYYLHVLDAVAGAAHFDLPETRARHLLAEVVKKLPGYLVPRLAREIPGEASKTNLAIHPLA
ncbi:MAG: EF-P beta-lysylation protein EpmB [Pseudomonadales bacterium]|nr:EF-P beta-lysylation protein EpmB [Pseudomonadales bacterium]MDP4640780.1 EF-P beta-lysylation protein EpmB [Pseudomonadales bacterium]MDP4765825.1 EF-P beta-lysylation protein EpmB [Pseudomonadales bacterium]